MNTLDRISQTFEAAFRIPIDRSTNIVLMSDCHRGDGNWGDNFSKNQHLFFAALSHYYRRNYIYIELGDGDELWENNRMSNIIDIHSDAFWILSRFYDNNRFYMIYGNHDMIKKDQEFVENNLYYYFNEKEKRYIPLFPSIKVYESIVLYHKYVDTQILLLHGHQVDFFNSRLWKLASFLVNFFWKPLELFGVNDPTRTAKNYSKKMAVEKKLIEWVKENEKIIIAGHTHRPVFPDEDEPQYFNDGSCVHPRSITAIEIAEDNIILVKWSVKTKIDGTLYVAREVLAGPRKLY